jgi:hypothetical protein
MRLPDPEREFLLAFEDEEGVPYALWSARPEGPWAEQRLAYFRRHGWVVCFVCERGPVVLHHRTYERIRDPLDSDLVALCSGCHHQLHREVERRLDAGDQNCLIDAHELLREQWLVKAHQRTSEMVAAARDRHERLLREAMADRQAVERATSGRQQRLLLDQAKVSVGRWRAARDELVGCQQRLRDLEAEASARDRHA